MVWWPFAPQPERADTPEVTGLNNGAPPLHSASSADKLPGVKGPTTEADGGSLSKREEK